MNGNIFEEVCDPKGIARRALEGDVVKASIALHAKLIEGIRIREMMETARILGIEDELDRFIKSVAKL